MSKKMTISELKQYVHSEAKRLFDIHVFRETRKSLKENVEEESSISQEIYDEIDMRMRPTDSRLPFDEIVDIANEYGVDEETVANIMVQYTIDRENTRTKEFKEVIAYIIQHSFDGVTPDFNSFYQTFEEFDYVNALNTNPQETREFYDIVTKDPAQLTLFENIIKNTLKEIGFNQNGEPYGFPEDDDNDPTNPNADFYKKEPKKHQNHKWSKSKEPCPVCGSNKNYTGPETGGWKSCANCGTV